MAFIGCQATWQPQQDSSESSNWAKDECYQSDPAVQKLKGAVHAEETAEMESNAESHWCWEALGSLVYVKIAPKNEAKM